MFIEKIVFARSYNAHDATASLPAERAVASALGAVAGGACSVTGSVASYQTPRPGARPADYAGVGSSSRYFTTARVTSEGVEAPEVTPTRFAPASHERSISATLSTR